MNRKLNGFTKGIPQSVTRRGVLNNFGLGFAGLALAVSLGLQAAAASSTSTTSSVTDPAGDAVFPYDLYDSPVPLYLDVVEASVSLTRGVFQFEIKVNSDIPANADPGFSPSANHLGATFGVLTDRGTAGTPAKFLGQTDVYRFNFLVGALYSVTDSGVGLSLGWTGFMISSAGVVAVPLKIQQDTFILEVSADALGNPTSFDWAVGSECDPVTIPDEKTRTVLLVDYAPDHGYATWPTP